ncbi:hypothetical protein DPMN_171080 [Dreissena polymorpha]|uniref:Uncharacterized protein n=1 Tax=Dreissena polymorpha TaxID=45954 RepID=A0A9D4IDU7_DREPO|nr:hypothetical protein DPMN_171080 [Dreissena polymorpha]
MELKAFPSFKDDLTDAPKQMKKITLSHSVKSEMVKLTYLMTASISEPVTPGISPATDQAMVRGIRSAINRSHTSEKITPNVSSARNQPMLRGFRGLTVRTSTSEQAK